MVAAQVIGHHAAINGRWPDRQLPAQRGFATTAANLLDSIGLLANVSRLLADSANAGLKVRRRQGEGGADRNPILVTALNPVIGYEQGAAIAKQAYEQGCRCWKWRWKSPACRNDAGPAAGPGAARPRRHPRQAGWRGRLKPGQWALLLRRSALRRGIAGAVHVGSAAVRVGRVARGVFAGVGIVVLAAIVDVGFVHRRVGNEGGQGGGQRACEANTAGRRAQTIRSASPRSACLRLRSAGPRLPSASNSSLLPLIALLSAPAAAFMPRAAPCIPSAAPCAPTAIPAWVDVATRLARCSSSSEVVAVHFHRLAVDQQVALRGDLGSWAGHSCRCGRRRCRCGDIPADRDAGRARK